MFVSICGGAVPGVGLIRVSIPDHVSLPEWAFAVAAFCSSHICFVFISGDSFLWPAAAKGFCSTPLYVFGATIVVSDCLRLAARGWTLGSGSQKVAGGRDAIIVMSRDE